jgi:nitrite reductase/ring-hydroxylating ferredoxin subunit
VFEYNQKETMTIIKQLLLLLAVAENQGYGLCLSSFSSLSSSAPPFWLSSLTSRTKRLALGSESTVTSLSSSSSSSFEHFDYMAHWYPVIWASDLLMKEPTKVTVFDVDYVVAKISETEVIALQDKCPHKAAALSEGRVTQSNNFQCAYHGWAFDGETGNCVDIPQIADDSSVVAASGDGSGETSKNSLKVPSRSCATAVPAQIHQEMVYLFVGGSAEEALLAPGPPSVPEYDSPHNFQMSCSIRDMPVDWPIVVSNICDADHGMFAHQATPFDMYAASKEFPMQVIQEFPNAGKGWTVHTKVDAAEKLTKVDRLRRIAMGETKGKILQEFVRVRIYIIRKSILYILHF